MVDVIRVQPGAPHQEPPQLRLELSRNGRELAEQFRWERVAEAFAAEMRAGQVEGVELVHDCSILAVVGAVIGVGVITGTVGINYSHELLHQKNKTERTLGDLLLAMVMY